MAAAQKQGMSLKRREPVFTEPPMLRYFLTNQHLSYFLHTANFRQVNVQFINGIALVAVSVPPMRTNQKGELVVPLVFVWKRELGPIESSWTMFVRIHIASILVIFLYLLFTYYILFFCFYFSVFIDGVKMFETRTIKYGDKRTICHDIMTGPLFLPTSGLRKK